MQNFDHVHFRELVLSNNPVQIEEGWSLLLTENPTVLTEIMDLFESDWLLDWTKPTDIRDWRDNLQSHPYLSLKVFSLLRAHLKITKLNIKSC